PAQRSEGPGDGAPGAGCAARPRGYAARAPGRRAGVLSTAAGRPRHGATAPGARRRAAAQPYRGGSLLMRLRTAVCAGLGLLLACKGSERAAVPVGGKVLLRYHPPSGANYRYVLDQESKIAFDSGAMGKMPDQQISMTMFMTQAVGAPAESGFSVVTTIDSSKVVSPLLGALAGSMASQTKGAKTTMV